MADPPASDAVPLSSATPPGEAAAMEATAAVAAGAAAGAEAPPATATGNDERVAPVAAQAETGGPPINAQERRASRRKTSLKKTPPRKGSVLMTEGDQQDEDDGEEEMVPVIIYPIDSKIQEILRKTWTLFIKKGQKKKTEIAELDIPTVMRSIAINPTEKEVKEVIANTRSQDVFTTSKGFLTYECFEQRMAETFQKEPDKYLRNSKERILAALYTISGGAKEMNAADLKKIMMTKGDAMTEQEAALMIRNAGDRDTGKVYIEEYGDVLSKDGIPQPPPDPTVW